MKYVKSFSVFESEISDIKEIDSLDENMLKKWFTGYASKEEEKAAADKFIKILDEVEETIKKNATNVAPVQGGGKKELNMEAWSLAKAMLLGQSKENKYLGGIKAIKSKSDDKVYLVYGKGFTGFEKTAMGTGYRVQKPLG